MKAREKLSGTPAITGVPYTSSGLSPHRLHQLARKHGVEIGATLEQYRRSRQDAAGLLE